MEREEDRKREKEVEIRTFSEANYDVVIPVLRVGYYDLMLLLIILGISVYTGSFFVVFFIKFFGYVFIFVGLLVDFLLFWYARREYEKTGRVDVLWEIFDYYVVENEIEKGREE